MQQVMHRDDVEASRAAIAALEGQRGTLGDTVVEMATAPLRARLAGLLETTPQEGMPLIQVQRQALQDTIDMLQARRAVLGGALVDAALSPYSNSWRP